MNRRIYLTTGEFAKLCNVKKDTLFHYDKVGVLKPEHVAENDYRYYSVEQYDVLTVILMLRELGMPLKDIKDYMEMRSPERLLTLLDAQERKIEERLKLYEYYQNALKKKASSIRKAFRSEAGSVEEEYQKREWLMISEPLSSFEEEEYAECTAKLVKKAEGADVYYDVTLGGIRLTEDLKKKDYISCTHIYFRVPEYTEGVVEKEAGRYLVTYHHGDFDTVGRAYQRMFAYAGEHRLKLGEEFYEDMIVDALGALSHKDYMMKIAVMIKEEGAVQ